MFVNNVEKYNAEIRSFWYADMREVIFLLNFLYNEAGVLQSQMRSIQGVSIKDTSNRKDIISGSFPSRSLDQVI